MKSKPFQPTTDSIIGRFEKQRWVGTRANRAEEIETVEFDATAYIVNMPAAAIRKVEDCNYSTDDIGSAHVDHDGPFSVCIEQAICTFFGVEAVSKITANHLRQAKVWLKSLPERHYLARVSLNTVRDIPVIARHPSQVRTLALKQAKKLAGKTANHIGFLSVHCCN
jgi:hypothetical protein